jgi:predicted ATPase/transcriptional regulator with XRE-family HTH domain
MADNPGAELAEYVRTRRLRAALTQEMLAERAGLTVDTVGVLERGLRRRLYPHTARAIADALGLSDQERAELAALARGSPSAPGDAHLTSALPPPVALAATQPDSSPPSVASAGLPSGSLPAPLSSFVGRERELTAVSLLLSRGVRLLTLTGAGGSGKTRLAVEAARVVGRSLPDGVWFIELASLLSPEHVPQAVATALGLGEAPEQSPTQAIVAMLRERAALLVLDNCEHVLDACAALVSALLRGCPDLTIVATSRLPLHVLGERQYAVPPLAVPNKASLIDIASLAAIPAVELFVERAQAVRADFALTGANAPAVAEICTRLDGLPLALELAAARVRALSPVMLLAHLDRRLPLLTGGVRDLPVRHQTIRNTVASAYDLLSASEQALYRRLAVFVGGFTLAAAESVCDTGDGLIPDVLEGIESLVDHSLLLQLEGVDGEPRFAMLEIIREYGLEQLAASGEETAVRSAHAGYFVVFVEDAGRHGPGRGALKRRLESDRANLRAAVSYCAAAADGGEQLLRLTAALGYSWFLQGHAGEGRAWCDAALATPAAADHPTLRARVLFTAGQVAWDAGNLPEARSLLDESITGARAAKDGRWLARALYLLGEVLWGLEEQDAARVVTEESAAVATAAGHTWELGLALQRLGTQAFRLGDWAGARTRYVESLKQLRRVDDPAAVAFVIRNLGYVAQAEGRYEEALRSMIESVTINQGIDDLRGVAAGIAALAGLFVALDDPQRAARLSGAVATVLGRAGASALHPRDRLLHDRTLAAERAALDQAELAALWANGHALTVEAAVSLASSGLDRAAGILP